MYLWNVSATSPNRYLSISCVSHFHSTCDHDGWHVSATSHSWHDSATSKNLYDHMWHISITLIRFMQTLHIPRWRGMFQLLLKDRSTKICGIFQPLLNQIYLPMACKYMSHVTIHGIFQPLSNICGYGFFQHCSCQVRRPGHK